MTKIVCLDFDGVVHMYTSPWTTPTEIADGPVPGIFDAIVDYIDIGYEIAIYSSRSYTIDGTRAMRRWFVDNLVSWLLSNNQPSDRLADILSFISFPIHKPPALIYIDDRGFRFEGKFPTVADIERRPWNKPEK